LRKAVGIPSFFDEYAFPGQKKLKLVIFPMFLFRFAYHVKIDTVSNHYCRLTLWVARAATIEPPRARLVS
jgi:hypothetical protein